MIGWSIGSSSGSLEGQINTYKSILEPFLQFWRGFFLLTETTSIRKYSSKKGLQQCLSRWNMSKLHQREWQDPSFPRWTMSEASHLSSWLPPTKHPGVISSLDEWHTHTEFSTWYERNDDSSEEATFYQHPHAHWAIVGTSCCGQGSALALWLVFGSGTKCSLAVGISSADRFHGNGEYLLQLSVVIMLWLTCMYSSIRLSDVNPGTLVLLLTIVRAQIL